MHLYFKYVDGITQSAKSFQRAEYGASRYENCPAISFLSSISEHYSKK